jgi:hypothetical protein
MATRSISQVSFPGPELLGRPTNRSITLNIVSSSALDAYIEYGTSSGAYTNTTSTVSQAANEPIVIVIDGLTANTKYYYRLRYRVSSSGGSFSARSEHSFHTQRPTGSTFTFTITSDSHVNIMLGNAATWQTTLSNVANDNPEFHLDLGDTFAMDNVTSESAARSAYIFQRTSTTLGLISPSVPIFLAVGNHEEQEGWHLDDNGDPVNSQPVWGTNAQKRYFPNPVPNDFYSGNSDTYYALSGDQLREDYYAWTWGDALFIVIDPFWYTMTKPFVENTGGGESSDVGSGDRWDWTLGLIQYNWLRQTLENSNATYKFIFAHHMTGGSQDYVRKGAYGAPYCEWGGYNENGTTWAFDTRRSGWHKPAHQMLVENGVSAFFHGHDHQYAYEMLDGVVYQSLPAAGFSGNGFNLYSESNPLTIKVLPSPGHLRVTVSPSQTTVDYVNTSTREVTYSYTIEAPSIEVNAKVFLQGPYSSGNMSTALNSAGYVPLTQPYNTSPSNYTGTERVASIPNGVVDWILLELRTGTDPASKVATRACFLKSDGSVVDLDGISQVTFEVFAGSYYIVVRHRNHLAIMSANPVALSISSSLYDFTTAQSQAYGTDPMKDLGSGIFGIHAGDASGNGQVQNDDKNDYWQTQVGTAGYKSADFSLNGQVQNDDKNDHWQLNVGLGTQVPP